MYVTVAPLTEVSHGVEKNSTGFVTLFYDTEVEVVVVEVRRREDMNRIRGRIADPAGWISLEILDNGHRWVAVRTDPSTAECGALCSDSANCIGFQLHAGGPLGEKFCVTWREGECTGLSGTRGAGAHAGTLYTRGALGRLPVTGAVAQLGDDGATCEKCHS
eukprot:gene58002-biopygen51950